MIIEFDLGQGPRAATIKLDGVELTNVQSFTVTKSVHEPTVVTLRLVPQVVVIRGEAERVEIDHNAQIEGALGSGVPG